MPVRPRTKQNSRKSGATQERELLFSHAYLSNGRNGKEAAISAGYSVKTAAVQAVQLLQRPSVRAIIDAEQTKDIAKYDLSKDAVLRVLASIVHFDIRKLYNEDGSLKSITDLDDDTASALAGMDVYLEKEKEGKQTVVVGETRKFKVHDKNRAVENAMKMLGLLKENTGTVVNAGTVIIAHEDTEVL